MRSVHPSGPIAHSGRAMHAEVAVMRRQALAQKLVVQLAVQPAPQPSGLIAEHTGTH